MVFGFWNRRHGKLVCFGSSVTPAEMRQHDLRPAKQLQILNDVPNMEVPARRRKAFVVVGQKRALDDGDGALGQRAECLQPFGGCIAEISHQRTVVRDGHFLTPSLDRGDLSAVQSLQLRE